MTQAQQEFKENYFDFQTGNWWLRQNNLFKYEGKSYVLTRFLNEKADEFNAQFAGAKVSKTLRLTEERVNTLHHLFREFLHQFELGQVDVEGYVQTSFSHLSKEAGLESSAFRKRILGMGSVNNFAKSKPEKRGHLLRNNIIQIKNIVKSKECSVKNGFNYTTFKYRIKPEYMPFIDDQTRQIWTELSLWKDEPIVKMDIVNAPTQAKYTEKRENAIKTRVLLESIYASDREQLFEELYEMNARQQDIYFENKRRALGVYATKKDCDKLFRLVVEFRKWSNSKSNLLYKIMYRKTSEDVQMENRFGEYSAQDLGMTEAFAVSEGFGGRMMPSEGKNILKGVQMIADKFQTDGGRKSSLGAKTSMTQKNLTEHQLNILQTIVRSLDLNKLYGRTLSAEEFMLLRESLPVLILNRNLHHQILAPHYDWIWKVQART